MKMVYSAWMNQYKNQRVWVSFEIDETLSFPVKTPGPDGEFHCLFIITPKEPTPSYTCEDPAQTVCVWKALGKIWVLFSRIEPDGTVITMQ